MQPRPLLTPCLIPVKMAERKVPPLLTAGVLPFGDLSYCFGVTYTSPGKILVLKCWEGLENSRIVPSTATFHQRQELPEESEAIRWDPWPDTSRWEQRSQVQAPF